ncbi:MAG: NTP transferase domain-containing protein [Bryobacteraceae bacterium]
MPVCLPVAAIVLAAGAATRMGKLKQLLPYRGRTLVQHAIDQALQAQFDPVLVVVGAESAAVRSAVATQKSVVIENTYWRTGMGSSISAGVRWLQKEGTESAAIAILLGDQPLVTADHLKEMRDRLHRTSADVIAAEYSGTLGVPAVFKRNLFARLSGLPPSAGARLLLRQPGLKVEPFPLPEAASDIDTPTDYESLTA